MVQVGNLKNYNVPTHRLKFCLTAGRFLRHEFRAYVKNLCFTYDLTLELNEDKSFWESQFNIVIIGPYVPLAKVKELLSDYILEYSD